MIEPCKCLDLHATEHGNNPKQARHFIKHSVDLSSSMNLILVGTPLPQSRYGRVKLSLPKGHNELTTERNHTMV